MYAIFFHAYDPFAEVGTSGQAGLPIFGTLAAALPVVVLFSVLVFLKARIWVAAVAGLVVALALAAGPFGMPLVPLVGALGSGVVFGLTRVGYIVFGSLFLYNVACAAGRFEIMKRSIAGLAADPRLQLILVAFCFGAFLEGTGGGGAPVAIAGAFLIGLGFPPFAAATLCLVANTAPVAWGAVGTPLRVLAGVTGYAEAPLSAMTGRILAPLSAILPIWLLVMFVGWKKTRPVLPAALVAGVSFAAMQFYWSNYQANGLVDIVAALFSLGVMVVFLKWWRPAHLVAATPSGLSRRQVVAGWSPFLLASLFILLTGWPSVQAHIVWQQLRVAVPGLHHAVMRMPPVVSRPEAEAAILDLNVLAMPGTVVVLAAIVAGLWAGLSGRRLGALFVQTLRELLPSFAAIAAMVGLAFVTRYSGMDTVLGLSLTRTGAFYPFFGTLLGWLGVALTGTDAGSNALFGNLQKVTAEQLGLPGVLMASANSAGGVMGKMIDAQSIVVSGAATRQVGNEAAIFRAVFKHSLALAALVGLIVMAYALWGRALVPSDASRTSTMSRSCTYSRLILSPA